MTGDQCPACSGRDVVGHQGHGGGNQVLFWSCGDCGFTWPRFTSPVSSHLVAASIDAADDFEPRSRRSDR